MRLRPLSQLSMVAHCVIRNENDYICFAGKCQAVFSLLLIINFFTSFDQKFQERQRWVAHQRRRRSQGKDEDLRSKCGPALAGMRRKTTSPWACPISAFRHKGALLATFSDGMRGAASSWNPTPCRRWEASSALNDAYGMVFWSTGRPAIPCIRPSSVKRHAVSREKGLHASIWAVWAARMPCGL